MERTPVRPERVYLWFEQKLLVVRQSPLLRPFVGSHDNEDTVTEAYVQAIAAMEASSDLAAPYTMAGSHDLNKTLVAEDGSLHHANRGCSAYPLLPETRDVYQFLTWKWAQKRMAIENDGVASASVHVFYSSALQLCISIGLFVLGCTQLPDGDFTYIVVSIFAGVVGTAASVYGVVGALTQSEGALLAFVSGQLWTLALLSSYLHVVVELFLSNERVCNPSLANFAGSTGCTRGWLVASCLLCVILLAVSFYTVFHALNLADGVNDRAGLNDEIIILKFFQRKLDEMHMHLEAKVESLTGSPAPNEKPVGETELAGSFQTCSSFTRVS
ncbi:hypothetical protein DIPPA_08357 [Diplonema papillatum]|nr:hypothetical protein DIPPA_08357 [Diplonema papillatum]